MNQQKQPTETLIVAVEQTADSALYGMLDTLIEYLQKLRIEEAKRLLEAGQMPVDDISIKVSYEDPSFFRCLFKRLTGLTPSQYRRMFQPIINATEPPV